MPRRLIEEAFPLKKVSKDSKHEKNVRHGHISTLHSWPARRPLAACRAVAIATLLPDPADAPETVKTEYERLADSPLPDKQRDYLCKLIESLTRWGDESGHGDWDARDQQGRWMNKLRIARELILTAYNGRAPKMMDMFAGGGAIPLETMRLGCEVTANDYNPVAWFILKCTLDYPQRFAGKTHQLPNLNLNETPNLGKGNLSDHVQLWGQWVFENARKELTAYYVAIDDKPTVAYLWARTIPCQDPKCDGTIPLLKTLWVCRKPEKTLCDTPENRSRRDFLRLKETRNTNRVIINANRALNLHPDAATKQVRFEIMTPEDVHDVGEPTMTGSTANCPFCGSQQPDDYIKRCGHQGKLKAQMTAVVYQEEFGKEYRPPTQAEINATEVSRDALDVIADEIPLGLPDEPLPGPETLGFRVPLYGFTKWSDLFTARQLFALMTFVKWTRASRTEMKKRGYTAEWNEAVQAYLGILVDRIATYNSTICVWINNLEAMGGTFARFALPITWDFAELNPFSSSTGGYLAHVGWVTRVLENICAITPVVAPCINQQSSREQVIAKSDAIITDPPYYDAIPYADLSDFFYVWLRRSVGDRFPSIFTEPLTPKSDELVQHAARFDGDRNAAKESYECGMAESFRVAHDSLIDGRMVIVFAHKDPMAWETMTTAMIDARLVVTAAWPIDTERQSGLRSKVASLATSLWIVCRRRAANARDGRYSQVKSEMRKRITERLRYFWDAGIQGPDFVWSAIGPALESYSRYDAVKRQDGKPFSVHEFLTEVRRMVTDFALGKILGGASTEALDDWTRYYLMHRNYFGSDAAPVGECILLAQGYGVAFSELMAAGVGILKKSSSGGALRLLGHAERGSNRLGAPHTSGALPIIDMVHCIMNLWEAGERAQLDGYLAAHGLHENNLYRSVVQALIEMSSEGSAERSLLETIINHRPSPTASGGTSRTSADDDDPQYHIEGIEP